MIKRNCCTECYYFHEYDIGRFQCRRYPMTTEHEWPRVHDKDDWCGEFMYAYTMDPSKTFAHIVSGPYPPGYNGMQCCESYWLSHNKKWYRLANRSLLKWVKDLENMNLIECYVGGNEDEKDD